MPTAKPKDWVNPRSWKRLHDPDCPNSGYLYRVTTDGTSVLVQRKKWNHPDEFRTMKKLSAERWEQFEIYLEKADKYEVARVLARIAKGTLK